MWYFFIILILIGRDVFSYFDYYYKYLKYYANHVLICISIMIHNFCHYYYIAFTMIILLLF